MEDQQVSLSQRASGNHPSGEGEIDPEVDQEADLWWGAFAGRTLWPSFLLCGLLTLVVAGGAWYLWDISRVSPQWARYAAYWLAGMIWFIQLLRWGYCTVSINYRLTTRRLFRDRGFRNPSAGFVELFKVTGVEVVPGRLHERLVGVGRVRVLSHNEKAPLVLEGIYRPEKAAVIISQAVQRAKQTQGTPGHHAELQPVERSSHS